jgi:hypothetical protein
MICTAAAHTPRQEERSKRAGAKRPIIAEAMVVICAVATAAVQEHQKTTGASTRAATWRASALFGCSFPQIAVEYRGWSSHALDIAAM